MNATATVTGEKILTYDARTGLYADTMKVRHDGQHFVACPIQKAPATSRVRRMKDGTDLHFEKAYFAAMKQRKKWKPEDLVAWISVYMVEELGDVFGLDTDWIRKEIDRLRHNAYLRERRFRDKAFLNQWNYFVTITYDEKKMNEEIFRAAVRKCFSNFQTRRGWKYMGVFERGDEGDRLHFHALCYIPRGELPGTLKNTRAYSVKERKWVNRLQSSFFFDRFGKNTFDPINRRDVKNGKVVNYVIKYILKSGERVIYSRGVPTELMVMVEDEQVAAEMYDFCLKFVLFDDAFVLFSDPDDDPEAMPRE